MTMMMAMMMTMMMMICRLTDDGWAERPWPAAHSLRSSCCNTASDSYYCSSYSILHSYSSLRSCCRNDASDSQALTTALHTHTSYFTHTPHFRAAATLLLILILFLLLFILILILLGGSSYFILQSCRNTALILILLLLLFILILILLGGSSYFILHSYSSLQSCCCNTASDSHTPALTTDLHTRAACANTCTTARTFLY